ncbi:Sly41 protein [Saccharomycopsis crataegensis]|uniref:Sly41 protein n=1 Tax=Saccharomycopsis crataegensis TaxID=43959 RepID=A0AAV5QLR3_9ASCO|nr:Sly41 protein [Saccharomycopsis crataegensis]
MIQTTYSTESHTHNKHRSGKNIHLSGTQNLTGSGENSGQDNNNSSARSNNLTPDNMASFDNFNDTMNGLHPVSHLQSGKNKNRRQRGLSISTGVSYTNFYSRVGGPNSANIMLHEKSHHGHDTKKGFKSIVTTVNKENLKIIFLCGGWYLTSILSSNVTKTILKAYKYPVTLTEIQFFITSLLCLVTYIIVFNNRKIATSFPLGTFPVQLTENKYTTLYDIIKPTRLILTQTIPMGMFQFVGHITSHNATSLISVSMVHTIKALSPIVTVLSYRFLFHVKYPTVTYVTLAPLVVGIMLTCLFKNHNKGHSSDSIISDSSAYSKGLVFAFISMLIFVSQNIFAKKILTYKTNLLDNSSDDGRHRSHQYSNILPIDKEEEATIKKISEKNKVDKLTILFYCSIVGFIFTFPIYLSSEIFSNDAWSLGKLNLNIICLMLFHGLVHFVQALLAFHILGLVSPVSYSIANIFKRIFVIVAALVWEAQPLNGIQAFGLLLTMAGLYCYDRWGTVKKQ